MDIPLEVGLFCGQTTRIPFLHIELIGFGSPVLDCGGI
jgi:hypothetical protein